MPIEVERAEPCDRALEQRLVIVSHAARPEDERLQIGRKEPRSRRTFSGSFGFHAS